jgi:hypothetical protein
MNSFSFSVAFFEPELRFGLETRHGQGLFEGR